MKFYYHPSPNPLKVALLLEETGLAYELVPVDTRKGEQHSAAFKSINPNAKTPALVDGDATVFDSNAILLYLADTFGLKGGAVFARQHAGWSGAEAWASLPHVKRLLDEINARPAAQRAEALKTPHAFKAEMDDAARQAMFPQNARLGK
jgi:glutathione S-transferase